ncbi:MAG TPA: LPS export ABC transporter periplasmic protein LptC [Prolixibacteraceae bacterium]|nr:LPS export ABC transporter periplasmic protein LptC [Prolixibacteraceae bacterium]
MMKTESTLSDISTKISLLLIQKKVLLFMVLTAMLLVSCGKETAKIKINSVTEELPSLTAEDFEMLVSDSTVIRFKLQTPEFIRHKNEKDPYTEFPKGVKIEKYDAEMNIVSSITCLYAKNFDSDNRWEAKNNVVAVNFKGDTLKTEYLVWDTEKQKIYSDRFVKIIQKDQVYTGIGFESNQDFSEYHIKNLKGNMYVNVDE